MSEVHANTPLGSEYPTVGVDALGHRLADDGAVHLKLEYEVGLPLRNSKLIVWLFLSTEIMFFSALIGTFIVIRFGAPVWPMTHEVHISEPIGAFNTFVLICSSVTIVLALEAARANKAALAKLFMLLTFALGCLFLGVKAYEYSAKFAHGFYPVAGHSRMYERADIYYASKVRERLNDPDVQSQIAELQKDPSKLSATEERSDLVEIGRIKKIVEEPQASPVDLEEWPKKYCRALTGAIGRARRAQRHVPLAQAAGRHPRWQHVGEHLLLAHRVPCLARDHRPDRVCLHAAADLGPRPGLISSKTWDCIGTLSTWCGSSCFRYCICFECRRMGRAKSQILKQVATAVPDGNGLDRTAGLHVSGLIGYDGILAGGSAWAEAGRAKRSEPLND